MLGGLDLAHQFGGIAADALGGEFVELDDAVGVDEEGGAIGLAGTDPLHVEVAGEGEGRIADHRVLHRGDVLGGVVPGLVDEVGVGGHREHLDTHLLQLLVVLGEVGQLGGADEGEVTGVEEEDRPLAGDVVLAHLDEFAVTEGVGMEGEDLAVDETHRFSLSLGTGDYEKIYHVGKTHR